MQQDKLCNLRTSHMDVLCLSAFRLHLDLYLSTESANPFPYTVESPGDLSLSLGVLTSYASSHIFKVSTSASQSRSLFSFSPGVDHV